MKNYFEIFEDEDIFSGGSPKKKFYDILEVANKNLVEEELDKLFARFAAAEKLLEEHGLEEELESKVSSLNYEFDKDVENIKKSLYIEIVGSIVSRNE